MNGYYFTEHVGHVLRAARDEAVRLNHEYVGTEHLLLGLLGEEATVADQILARRSVDKRELRHALENTIKQGNAEYRGTDLPYTSRAKRVLEFAMETARDLRDDYFGTEHLLIGLLRERTGIAAQVMTDSGLTVEESLKDLAAIRRGSDSDGPMS